MKDSKNQQSWSAAIIAFAFVLLVMLVVFSKCGGDKSERVPISESAPVSESDVAYLDSLCDYEAPQSAPGHTRRILEECLAASSKDAFKEMNRICNRGDEAALRRMIADGRVRVIPANTEVTWLGYSPGVNEVRLDGRTWFVSQEFVSK